MTQNTTFLARKAGQDCPMCPDNHAADVVAELSSGNVHLQNDADYRGYCILIFRRHVVELHELTAEERARWIEDMARIGSAISQVCAPDKLNVAMLGNLVPHLHCHFMPRYMNDPDWGHPPVFRTPAERSLLTTEAFEALRNALADALARRA